MICTTMYCWPSCKYVIMPYWPGAGMSTNAQALAGLLVDGAQNRFPARTLGMDEEALRHHSIGMRVDASGGEVDSFEGRVVFDALRRVPVRDLPEVLAGVHVDGRDPAVRRLVNRETLRVMKVSAIRDHPVRDRLSCGHGVVRLVHVEPRHDVLGSASGPGGYIQDPGLRIR